MINISVYTTIKCKCIVKVEYRELIKKVFDLWWDRSEEIGDEYLRRILEHKSRFGNFFKQGVPSWIEEVEDEEEADKVLFHYDVQTGEWHFHTAINHECWEIEEFIVRFSPKYLEQIYFLQIYNEGSVERYLEGEATTYWVTEEYLRNYEIENGTKWKGNLDLG